MPSQDTPMPWQQLQGKIDPAIFSAPKTCGDPAQPGIWPMVHQKIVTYIVLSMTGKPWADHLALAAAVLIARHRDVRTVLTDLGVLHTRFMDLFQALQLATMAEWDAEQYMVRYLQGSILPNHDPATRNRFWIRYNSVSKELQRWLTSLPSAAQTSYQPFVLPIVSPLLVEGLIKSRQLIYQQQQRRKQQTDALLPHFATIRAEAHFRYNRMVRLRQAYQEALRMVQQTQPPLPFAFSYDEGGNVPHGIPPQERLHFRIWDRRSFVLAHPDAYSGTTVRRAQLHRDTFTDARNSLFLEFVRAERLDGDAPPRGLWFAELFQQRVVGHATVAGPPATRDQKQAWLTAWGYGLSSFITTVPGLLMWPNDSGDGHFVSVATAKTSCMLIPVEPVYAAATFGLLAIDLFTTTGMRMNEALQIRLDPDCFVLWDDPRRPNATVRYLFRLIPKGERRDRPQNYFIGEETKRVIVKVAHMLEEHYGLNVAAGDTLPKVPFNPNNKRAHRFGSAGYLFQYAATQLRDHEVTVCMRFLLHGMAFHDRAGQPVPLNAHLLRHAFATHAVHVEELPLDIVAAMLKQKGLEVTAYYSQPTDHVIAEAADRFLNRLATRISVGEAVTRAPHDLRQQLEAAQQRVGTLSAVKGGTCTCHAICPIAFACIGCPAKVPDPAQRSQVEREKERAQFLLDEAESEGRLGDAERMRQLIRECAVELHEMALIDAYRKDASHVPTIWLAPR